MFDKNLEFTGKHGAILRKLTESFDSSKAPIFKAGYVAYKNAAIIGFLYHRKAKKDSSAEKSFTIFLDQLKNVRDDLEFNYRLIMLLDKDHEPDLEKRLHKAFNIMGTPEALSDEVLFEEYSLGGLEVLYNEIIEKSKKPEDYWPNLFNFIQNFNRDKSAVCKPEDLIKMCKSIKIK